MYCEKIETKWKLPPALVMAIAHIFVCIRKSVRSMSLLLMHQHVFNSSHVQIQRALVIAIGVCLNSLRCKCDSLGQNCLLQASIFDSYLFQSLQNYYYSHYVNINTILRNKLVILIHKIDIHTDRHDGDDNYWERLTFSGLRVIHLGYFYVQWLIPRVFLGNNNVTTKIYSYWVCTG